MPLYSFFSPSSSSNGRRGPQSGGDAEERLIPFPARSTSEPEPGPRRRRPVRDLDRGTAPRRVRRRRQGTTSWLQRNALSVAAASILVALLGLGFGLLQTINRPESTPALLAINPSEATTAVTAGLINGATQSNASASPTSPAASDGRREIQAGAKVIDPSYTVQPGDTLGRIAVQFGTSPERIQALNNLTDPRALRIGTRLVIPPPL